METKHARSVDELLEFIGGNPCSVHMITKRGWLSVELVISNWRGRTWGWIYSQQAKLLWNFWRRNFDESRRKRSGNGQHRETKPDT